MTVNELLGKIAGLNGDEEVVVSIRQTGSFGETYQDFKPSSIELDDANQVVLFVEP